MTTNHSIPGHQPSGLTRAELLRRSAFATGVVTAGGQLATLDGRMVELEAEIRRRIEELGADADAERAVIEARLQELLRRLDSAATLQSS
jgi:hypothetical protein